MAMASDALLPRVTFYDIRHTLSPETRSWSPFTIRTALALKHRKIPYKRHTISFGNVASFLASKGVPEPAGKSNIKYTLPAISLQYTDGTEEYLMDSTIIARKLEELVPASPEHPSLFPEGSEHQLDQAEEAIDQAIGHFRGFIIAWTPSILDARGQEYFISSREAMLGATLESKRAQHPDDELPGTLRTALKFITKLYQHENASAGIFCGGRNEPSYSDIVVVACIEWWRCIRGDEIIDDLLKVVENGVLLRVMEHYERALRH